MNAQSSCSCLTSAAPASQFTTLPIGTDATHGRFGEATIEQCQQCHRCWLKYVVEYEGTSQSARWFRGELKAEQTVHLLEQLPEVVYGGSYFTRSSNPDGSIGGKGHISITVDA